MKTYLKHSLVTLPLFCCLLTTLFLKNCQGQIAVESFFLEKDNPTQNEISLKVKITNLSGELIRLPKVLHSGLNKDPIADFIIEFQKKESDSNFQPLTPPDEYMPSYNKASFIEFNNNEVLNDEIDLAFFYAYKFPFGCYRVRVLFKISKYNNIKDVYSNWTEFVIK